GSLFKVTVKFYDEDKAYFGIRYDSESGTKLHNLLGYTYRKGIWSEYTFVLDDAYFADRLTSPTGEAADFCITSYIEERANTHGGSQPAIVIGGITVEKIPGKNPVYVNFSTDEVGNIFNDQTEKKFKIDFTNRLKEENEYKVTYRAVHENGETSWSSSENIKIGAEETIQKEVVFDVSRYGLYNFFVDIENKNTDSTFQTVFSNVLTAADGLTNKHHRANIHFGLYGNVPTYWSDVEELLEKGNMGGWRDTPHDWSVVYKPERGFRQPASSAAFFEARKERYPEGDPSIVILGYGNPSVTDRDVWSYPTSESELSDWENYVRYMCEVSGCSRFQVWNEPNIKSNANENVSQYIEICRRAEKVIHEYNPDYKIAVGTLAGPYAAVGMDYFNLMIENGIMDIDFDAIAGHPYAREPEAMVPQGTYYKDLCKKYGKDDIELWYTEYGCTTGLTGGVSERRSENINIRQYLAMNVRGMGDEWARYELVGSQQNNKYDDEHNWGAVQTAIAGNTDTGVAYSAKWAYVAIAAMNYLLRDAEVIGPVEFEDDSELWASNYKKSLNDDELLAIWSTGADKTVTLDLGCDSVQLYDMWGNNTEIKGENGLFTISVRDRVQYLVGKFKKIEKISENLYNVDSMSKTMTTNDKVTFSVSAKEAGDKQIEVSMPSNLTLLNEPTFVDGKADIVIGSSDEVFTDESNVEVIIKNGDTRLQAIDYYITCNEVAADISVSTSPENGENVKDWKAVIKVKNNSNATLIQGRLVIKEPKQFRGVLPVKTGPIGPGDTAEINVDLPELDKLGQYPFSIEFEDDKGGVVRAETNIDFTAATYAENKPVIDGEIETGEWNWNSALYSEDSSQVVLSGWRGKSDLSGATVLEWDEENLYVASKIMDDVFYFDPNEEDTRYIWKNDSIQIGFIYGTVSEVVIGTANRTFEEIGMGMTPNGAKTWRWSTQSNHETGEIKGAEVAIARHGAYTHYELKVPWKAIIPETDEPPKDGDKIGFSMLINDNDGRGRRGWMEYASGIGGSKDSTLFTYMSVIK
ncbi:MAG: sugar-binding protein, partial [Clostridia bacterium]|nr:sugar-binding protein [Clostridia bacterium]